MGDKIHRNSLQPGHKLHWYRIEKILGQGGFGITYLAHDFNLDRKVAIKEYLPIELAVRERDFSVHPVSENHGEKFRWGLDRFITEARTLAKFKHPNIVHVLNVFEENNTAYMVMEYEQGESLQEILTRRKTLEEAEFTNILIPILGGLQKVHDAGFIHRDIKPANIFIREDGSPVLLDFGSARQALSMATQTLTSLVSPGYAPYEQYYSKSDQQGPWTDIYGLGATLYRAIAGKAPMDAVDRSRAILKGEQDNFVPASQIGKGRYTERFLQAIDHALQFKEEERPKTISAWKQEFNLPEDPIRQAIVAEHTPTQPGTKIPERQQQKRWIYSRVAILVVLVGIGVLYLYHGEIQDYLFGPTKAQLEAERQRVEQEKRLAVLKHKEEEDRRRKEEEKRAEEERQAELERQREEEIRKLEAERLAIEEERKRLQEEEQKRAEAEAKRQAEIERQRAEDEKNRLGEEKAKRETEGTKIAELEKQHTTEEERQQEETTADSDFDNELMEQVKAELLAEGIDLSTLPPVQQEAYIAGKYSELAMKKERLDNQKYINKLENKYSCLKVDGIIWRQNTVGYPYPSGTQALSPETRITNSCNEKLWIRVKHNIQIVKYNQIGWNIFHTSEFQPYESKNIELFRVRDGLVNPRIYGFESFKGNLNTKIFAFGILASEYRKILDNEENLPYSLIYEENY